MIAFRRRLASIAVPTRFDSRDIFHHLAVVSVSLALLTGAMMFLDPRAIQGEAIWLKPFKFAVSFAILFGTFCAIAGRLTASFRRNAILLGVAVTSGAAALGEMAYIAAQAARQEASHFNDSTPWHEMMYGLMGTGSTVLMIGVAAMGAAAVLDRDAQLTAPARHGIGLGAALTVVLTLWIAGELAGNGGRFVGTPTPGGAAVPIFGWSLEVGDLRPAHFLSLHALQALPAAGWLVGRAGAAPRVVWAVAACYAMATVVVFLLARSGRPILPGFF